MGPIRALFCIFSIYLFVTAVEGNGKMIFHSILCVKSKLMWCELTCALQGDQESISGIGQPWPSRPSLWQFAVDRHTASARWGAGEPKWNANTGHISQGSLIGTQLLQGPSIPWSAAEAEEPVGHHHQVRFSLCVQLKIPGLKWLEESTGKQTLNAEEQRASLNNVFFIFALCQITTDICIYIIWYIAW